MMRIEIRRKVKNNIAESDHTGYICGNIKDVKDKSKVKTVNVVTLFR